MADPADAANNDERFTSRHWSGRETFGVIRYHHQLSGLAPQSFDVRLIAYSEGVDRIVSYAGSGSGRHVDNEGIAVVDRWQH